MAAGITAVKVELHSRVEAALKSFINFRKVKEFHIPQNPAGRREVQLPNGLREFSYLWDTSCEFLVHRTRRDKV